MRHRTFLLLLLLLPGLLLPLGARMSVCLCGDGHAGTEMPAGCAGKHCCTDPDVHRSTSVSAVPCAGCRNLVAPQAPPTLGGSDTVLASAPASPPVTFVLPIPPAVTFGLDDHPRVAGRGPPLSSATLPLRI
jgi:hypothetical protein